MSERNERYKFGWKDPRKMSEAELLKDWAGRHKYTDGISGIICWFTFYASACGCALIELVLIIVNASY